MMNLVRLFSFAWNGFEIDKQDEDRERGKDDFSLRLFFTTCLACEICEA